MKAAIEKAIQYDALNWRNAVPTSQSQSSVTQNKAELSCRVPCNETLIVNESCN